MTLVGRALSPEQRRAVQDDPGVVEDVLYADEEDADDAAEGAADGAASTMDLDLDKAWHGIHYLLTGSSWEVGEGAGAAILGGDVIGEDNGYGPARLLSPTAVRAVAEALAAVDVATLRARFDPKAMTAAEIYPEIWDEGAGAFEDYLAPHYDALRTFYRAAAADGRAVLLAIT